MTDINYEQIDHPDVPRHVRLANDRYLIEPKASTEERAERGLPPDALSITDMRPEDADLDVAAADEVTQIEYAFKIVDDAGAIWGLDVVVLHRHDERGEVPSHSPCEHTPPEEYDVPRIVTEIAMDLTDAPVAVPGSGDV